MADAHSSGAADGHLPEAIHALPEIRRRIGERRCGFFLDLDGTLAPIAPRPDLLRLPAKTRTILSRLASRHVVCVVSGRGLDDLRQQVGLDSLCYAAAHGHRIVGPAGSGIDLEVGAEHKEELRAAAQELRDRLLSVEGVVLEEKGLSLSVHYRLVPERERPAVARAVAGAALSFPALRLTTGKLVHELRPPGDWDKGRAVLWLLETLGWGPRDSCPICLGDDLTDEDMFAAVDGWGVAMVVGDPDRSTRAHYRLRDSDEVTSLLESFAPRDG
jgi:trehalose-phosphatase